MAARISEARVGKIRQTISEMQAYRFCGPSDDPDEISAVTLGFRHLLIQLQRAAGPVLPERVAARLDALEVEPNDLFSALNANAEVEALVLDMEEAIERLLPPNGVGGDALPSGALPIAVCSIVGQVLGSTIYHHKTLENLFYRAGAAGDVPEGNCVTKCQSWLGRLHLEVEDPLQVLGRVVEEFMEVDHPGWGRQTEGRREIRDVLARYGMNYLQGGHISSLAAADSTRTVLEHLRERNLDSVEEEVQRSLQHAVSDPAAAGYCGLRHGGEHVQGLYRRSRTRAAREAGCQPSLEGCEQARRLRSGVEGRRRCQEGAFGPCVGGDRDRRPADPCRFRARPGQEEVPAGSHAMRGSRYTPPILSWVSCWRLRR